ncbi:MAG: trehalose-6-phosphate synthase [Deltaproteobacteria bacterium CG11_big_fil_rev_8_21_14_0_20_49_13]|nr:MAG: trehalose-6-phosphate synthase [Deltaproteobacteria bacterium CG11_big_fil_rev_8_21_14_0_20_49_13]
MKITARFIVSLIVAMVIVAGVFSYFNVTSEKKRLQFDVEHRAWLVAEGMRDSIAALAEKSPSPKMERLLDKISKSKQVPGIAVYDTAGEIINSSKDLPELPTEKPKIIFDNFEGTDGRGEFVNTGTKKLYVFAVPVSNDEGVRIATLVIFNDVSYIDEYLLNIWKRGAARLLTLVLIVSVITILIFRWSVLGPIAKMTEWIKGAQSGEVPPFNPAAEDLFAPISKEISNLTKTLAQARAAAEEEAKLRQTAEAIWTGDRLKEHVKVKLGDTKMIVVSNREPYMHVKKGKEIECIRPASGLITALEPILRASGGTWVAHGAGNADKETVDKNNIVKVPPGLNQYDLKRVWLTQEEEEGYYYGFSNEGLWPLCHIAHTRPTFRANDWARYKDVNLKFARSLDDEIKNKDSVVFIQDYHFTVLPRAIKEHHENSKVALFWHIPWPNPEAFAICPWKREILHGMLGSNLIGFHTQFHCNNFLETIDRTLECRIDWEHFSVTRLGHTTFVKPFPISIDFNASQATGSVSSKEELLRNLDVKAAYMGIGVDRMDYTKGIMERFRAIERFFEKYPQYSGLFTFVQIGAPSREHIKKYHDLIAELTAESERINWKLQSGGWKPIVFLKKYFSHEEIEPYYRAADLCIVSSLHDGMNLVAKEFISSRENESGVLILSTFTGAARELSDALLINPYDIEQSSDMIRTALEMGSEEQALRMNRMRAKIRENNIFKWASDIITEIAKG